MAVLITGATEGIGLEIARLFAAEHADLVLVARNKDRLSEVAQELETSGSRVAVIAADLSEQGAAERVYQQAGQAAGPITDLVNNAGFGGFGAFSGTDLDTELSMIRLNISSLTVLTKLALNDMMQRDGGRIMNVASTAAFQPGPLMAVYYASKAYVLSFSEALSEELRGTGITVTTLCPGPTKTRFQKRAGLDASLLVSGPLVASAASVALAGIRGMKKGKRLVTPGLTNRLFAGSVRFMPRSLVLKIIRSIQERRTS